MENAPRRSIPSRKRPDNKLFYERKLAKRGFTIIIGVDEAGRGPLAGPVVSAAVHLKKLKFDNPIDDSKKLSPQGRERAFREIIQNAVFGIGIVSEKIIDRLNILEATRLSMQKAVDELAGRKADADRKNAYVIVDGNMFVQFSFLSEAIVKGDAKSLSIAAASILAKVTRDNLMLGYEIGRAHV